MTRLLLVRHAPTAATRRGAFPADEAIAPDALASVHALAAHLPSADVALSSPALRCRQTAEAIRLGPELDPALAECDFGAWAGLTYGELAERDPTGLDGWLQDPDAAPHGGESLRRFSERVRAWLETAAAHRRGDQTILAVTHAGVIRSAIAHALAAPLDAVWRIAAAPLSITELRADDTNFTLVRANWTVPA